MGVGIAAAVLLSACFCFFHRRPRQGGAQPPRAAAELHAPPPALPAVSSAPKAPPLREGVAAALRAAEAAMALAAAAAQRATAAAAARGGAPQGIPVASAAPAKQRSGLCPCILAEEPGWVVATRRNAAAAAAALSAPASEDLAAWEARARADLLAVRAALHEEGLLMAKRDQPAGAARAADEKLRLYGCCTPTGTFCAPKFAAWCRRDSALAEFGSGVTLYFKLLKYMAIVSFLLASVVAPQAAFNYFSRGASPGLDELGFTTAGALQPRNGSLLYVDASGTATMAAPELARLYAYLDLAGLALLLVSFFWVRRAVAAEEALVDGLTLTLQDYTVLLTPLPSGTTEACIREWVASASSELDAGALAEKIDAEAAPGATRLPLPTMREDVFRVARVTLVPTHRELLPLLKSLAGAYTAREGAMGALKARALRRAARRGACCGELRADVVDPAACQRPVCGMADPLVAPLVQAELAVRHAAVGVSAAMRALLEERARVKEAGGSVNAVAAFVVFEHAAAKDAFLTLYPDNSVALCCQRCYTPARQLRGATTRPVEAPQPSALLYHNMGVSACERRVRVALANVIFLALLSISVMAIYFSTSLLATLQRDVNLGADCSTAPVTTFVDLLAGSSPAERALFNNTVPANNVMQYCLCAKQGFGAFKTAAAITSHPMFFRCPFHACQSQLVKNHPSCSAIAAAQTTLLVGGGINSAVVAVVDAAFNAAAPFVASLRSHISVEEEYAAMAQILFFGKFINMVVLQVLVKSLTASITDFTFNFYVSVGMPLLWNFFLVNILNFFSDKMKVLLAALLCGHRFHDDTTYLKNTAASTVHQTLLGSPFDMVTRLTTVMSSFFLAYIFSPTIPVFMTFAGVAFTLAYWIDKGLLLYVHQRPPFTRSNLVKTMVNLIPLAAILHGAVATWLYGGITFLYSAAPRPPNATAAASSRGLRALLVPTLAALSSRTAGGLGGAHLPRALASNCNCTSSCAPATAFFPPSAFSPLLGTACSVNPSFCFSGSAPLIAPNGTPFKTCLPALGTSLPSLQDPVRCGCLSACGVGILPIAGGTRGCLVSAQCTASTAYPTISGLGGELFRWAPCGANASAPLLSTFGCPCEGACSASSTLKGLFTCPVSYSGCPFADGSFSPGGALTGSTDICSTAAPQPSADALLCMYQ